MLFFNVLLFLAPVFSLLKIELVFLILPLMLLSLIPTIASSLKNAKLSPEEERMGIIHPVGKESIAAMLSFIVYQAVSLAASGGNMSQVKSGALILATEMLCLLFCLGMLYIITNCRPESGYGRGVQFLAKGLFFSAILLLIDWVCGHKLLQFITTDSLLSSGQHGTSTSAYGQQFCLAVIWAPVAFFLASGQKKSGLATAIVGLIIAILPVFGHGFNGVAIWGFMFGALGFLISTRLAKHITAVSSILFVAILLIVPVIFLFGDPEKVSWAFGLSNKASYEFCSWDSYAHRIISHFWFGEGFNAINTITDIPHCSLGLFASMSGAKTQAPHINIGMQLMLELGAFGTFAAAVIAVSAIAKTANRHGIWRKNTVATLAKHNISRGAFIASVLSLLVQMSFVQSIWSAQGALSLAFMSLLYSILVISSQQ